MRQSVSSPATHCFEITGVEMVDALAEADGFVVTDDTARDDAVRVAVVS